MQVHPHAGDVRQVDHECIPGVVSGVLQVQFAVAVGIPHRQGRFVVAETTVSRVLLRGHILDQVIGRQLPQWLHDDVLHRDPATPVKMPEHPVGGHLEHVRRIGGVKTEGFPGHLDSTHEREAMRADRSGAR